MFQTLCLLPFLILTTLAHPPTSPLQPRNLLTRQSTLETCASQFLLACTSDYTCCLANEYCDGVGCCRIGHTCSGPPTTYTKYDHSSTGTFDTSTSPTTSKTTYLNTVTDAPVTTSSTTTTPNSSGKSTTRTSSVVSVATPITTDSATSSTPTTTPQHTAQSLTTSLTPSTSSPATFKGAAAVAYAAPAVSLLLALLCVVAVVV